MTGRTLRTWLLPVIVALLAAAGCASPAPGEPGTPTHPPLAETSWQLQSLGATGALRSALSTVEVTLEFSDDSRVSGKAACNSYFGQYVSATDGALSVSALGSTKMFCNEPGVMQQEQDLLNALSKAERYEVSDGLLRITGGGMELVLAAA
ncbi:MAG: META domain-containing protein [Dehalococcoidia bacterium]|jgi:heat shock protein HslJ|nr:META domain-containing protein [Dehalococcoidia bacterium]